MSTRPLRPLRIGHRRWFAVNCSMMLYEWDGKNWVFTGVGRRVGNPQ